MSTILHVSAGPRGPESHSHRIACILIDQLRARDRDATVLARRLDIDPPPFIDAAFANAMPRHVTRETSQGVEALATSEIYLDELECCDVLVISTPMHNFTVPASLKAWIDQVLRFGRTFESTPEGKVGRLHDRPTFVVVSSGGLIDGAAARQPDFLRPYLSAVLATLGIASPQFILVEAASRGEPMRAAAYAAAELCIGKLLGGKR